MPLTPHPFFLSGLRHLAARKRLVAGLVALAVLVAFLAAGRHVLRSRDQESFAREQAFAVSPSAKLEWCVEGAVLFNDVRWAVACRALAEEGKGNGFADCELPDNLATRLYAALQQEEHRCAVESQASRLQ